jgi:hypothetical protein
LACTFPCRRFADILANACARLEADVVRYSFIVVDLHHLLLAGLPAHLCKNSTSSKTRRMAFSDRLKIDRAKKLSFLKFRSDERFVLSIFNAAAFLHNQDPLRTSLGAPSHEAP